MKCTAMKLTDKRDHFDAPKRSQELDISTPIFTANESHSYCFPFIKKRRSSQAPSLKVTTLNFPEGQCFNTGSSLEKWSKKRPRLKSAIVKSSSRRLEQQDGDKTFCYESLNEADLSVLLGDNVDFRRGDRDDDDDNDSLSNLKYEVHSDIEQLLLKTERSGNDEEATSDWKPRKSRKSKHRAMRDEHQSKKSKRKSGKVRISKPPSPQTEQVIRVDVTSNVSCEDCVHKIKGTSLVDGFAAAARDETKTTHHSPITANLIDDGENSKDHHSDDTAAAIKKELKRNSNVNEEDSQHCQEHTTTTTTDDFIIVRCRQLALSQRRR